MGIKVSPSNCTYSRNQFLTAAPCFTRSMTLATRSSTYRKQNIHIVCTGLLPFIARSNQSSYLALFSGCATHLGPKVTLSIGRARAFFSSSVNCWPGAKGEGRGKTLASSGEDNVLVSKAWCTTKGSGGVGRMRGEKQQLLQDNTSK